MSARRSEGGNRWLVAGAVVAVVLALAGWRLGWFGGAGGAELLGAEVEKKQLVVSVVQRGNLAARDPIVIHSEIEGQTTILKLVKEGTLVQPGDLLVELDASELQDRRVGQEIAVQNAEATYVKARAQFDIQESQNKSDIETAERRKTFAELDREKYLMGDWEQLKAQAEEKIKLAEAELAKARNTYEWSKNLAERGFLMKSELDGDELDFQRADVSLKQAQRAKELLVSYDDPRRRTELEANVTESERGLERAQLQAQARLADYQSSLATSKSKLDLEQEKLRKILDQLVKSRIVAPEAGMVVHARVEGGGRGGSSEPLQVGTTVRERQEILSIPRQAGLIVEASVHESVLKQVVAGKPCQINVDALPGQRFDGRVQFVAQLPDKGSWWANPNQRLYATEILVLDVVSEMKPGMSCSVEILNEIVPEALVVPLQCVFLDAGEPIALVVSGSSWERRSVETGRSSQTLVEVVKGLEAGEKVLLSAPPGFTPRAAPRSNEIDAADFPPAEAPVPGRGAQGASEARADGDRAVRAGPDGQAPSAEGAAPAAERPAGDRPGGSRPGGRRGANRPAAAGEGGAGSG